MVCNLPVYLVISATKTHYLAVFSTSNRRVLLWTSHGDILTGYSQPNIILASEILPRLPKLKSQGYIPQRHLHSHSTVEVLGSVGAKCDQNKELHHSAVFIVCRIPPHLLMFSSFFPTCATWLHAHLFLNISTLSSLQAHSSQTKAFS